MIKDLLAALRYVWRALKDEYADRRNQAVMNLKGKK